MKKITSFIFCTVLLSAGCTSPEQDQKIQSFWMEQYVNVMTKIATRSANGANETDPQMAQLVAMLQASLNAKNVEQTPVEEVQTEEVKPAAAPSSTAAPAKKKLPQILEVTMDENAFPGKAPLEERILIKQAWNEVQEDNHEILLDIQKTFGEEVKSKAFLITTRTEQDLKKEATEATSFKAYSARQKQIVDKQKTALQQLMRQNKNNIKPLKQY